MTVVAYLGYFMDSGTLQKKPGVQSIGAKRFREAYHAYRRCARSHGGIVASEDLALVALPVVPVRTSPGGSNDPAAFRAGTTIVCTVGGVEVGSAVTTLGPPP